MPFYFLPNFLSTGLGERFCALWRMLHLASAAAHDKRAGGQDRVTPRMQRGAELRSSRRLRVSRCRAATVTGGCTRRGATRARGGLGVCTASLTGPAACTSRLYGTAIRHSVAPCTAASPARAQLLHRPAPCTTRLPAPSSLRRPAACTARLPAPSSLHSTALSLHGTAPLCATQLPACSLRCLSARHAASPCCRSAR